MKKLSKIFVKAVAVFGILSMLLLASCSDGSSSSNNDSSGSSSSSSAGGSGAGGSGGSGGGQTAGVTYEYNAAASTAASAVLNGAGNYYVYMKNNETIKVFYFGTSVNVMVGENSGDKLKLNDADATSYAANTTYTYTSGGKTYELKTGATVESAITITEKSGSQQGNPNGGQQTTSSEYTYSAGKSLANHYYTYTSSSKNYVVITDGGKVYVTDGLNSSKLKLAEADATTFDPGKEYSATLDSLAVTVKTGASLTENITIEAATPSDTHLVSNAAKFKKQDALYQGGLSGYFYICDTLNPQNGIGSIYVMILTGMSNGYYYIDINQWQDKNTLYGDGNIVEFVDSGNGYTKNYSHDDGKVYKFTYNSKTYYLVNCFGKDSEDKEYVAFFCAE